MLPFLLYDGQATIPRRRKAKTGCIRPRYLTEGKVTYEIRAVRGKFRLIERHADFEQAQVRLAYILRQVASLARKAKLAPALKPRKGRR